LSPDNHWRRATSQSSAKKELDLDLEKREKATRAEDWWRIVLFKKKVKLLFILF
jgi:hypothetical protein